MRAKPIRIKPKTRTIATQPKVLHSHRLIAILDNLIAGSIAALFAGIALLNGVEAPVNRLGN